MKKLFNRKKSNKDKKALRKKTAERLSRGITMVEVIVAMALLVTITTTTFMSIGAAMNKTTNTVIKFRAINKATDLIEIYKYSETQTEFMELAEDAIGCERVEYENTRTVFVFKVYTIKVQVMNNSVFLQAFVNNSPNEPIYSTSFHSGEDKT